jgi:hypothetical protein
MAHDYHLDVNVFSRAHHDKPDKIRFVQQHNATNNDILTMLGFIKALGQIIRNIHKDTCSHEYYLPVRLPHLFYIVALNCEGHDSEDEFHGNVRHF